MPLNVAIVGGGIAGLSAGLSLRRAGHLVHIYERSGLSSEVGAAINVPPNAARPLLRWGLDPAATRLVTVREIAFHVPFTLQNVHAVPIGERVARQYGAPFYFAHRVDLHQALRDLATGEAGPGTPVTIHLRSEVAEYNTDAPSITLRTGEVITADLVIAADGIHSTAVEAVLGRPNPPQPQEHYNCCYRFLIPAAALAEDPETRFFVEGRDGKMRIYADNDNRRRIVCYPCRDNEIMNFVGMFYDDSMEGSRKEDWHASANKTKMLDTYEGFHPGLMKVLAKAEDVMYWPLLYRAPVPTWRKGKLVLAGDSAHPMLPHQGQGGAQGLEDGVALGIVLIGAGPEDVEQRIAIYERLRRNRASAIQILSNAGQDQSDLIHEEAAKYMDSNTPVPKSPQEFTDFNFGHDIVKEAERSIRDINESFRILESFFQKPGPFYC